MFFSPSFFQAYKKQRKLRTRQPPAIFPEHEKMFASMNLLLVYWGSAAVPGVPWWCFSLGVVTIIHNQAFSKFVWHGSLIDSSVKLAHQKIAEGC